MDAAAFAFPDYLREQNIRVISIAEKLDPAKEKDDRIIGVRGLLNDCYTRDIGKKVRAGLLQKQREPFCPHDPLAERKLPDRVCLQRVSPKRESLLHFSTSHRTHEEAIGKSVRGFLLAVLEKQKQAQSKIRELDRICALREPVLNAQICGLKERMTVLEREVDEIAMDRILNAK